MCDNVKRCNINNVPKWGVLSGVGMLCIVNNTNITNISRVREKIWYRKGSRAYMWDIILSDNDDIIGQLISGM